MGRGRRGLGGVALALVALVGLASPGAAAPAAAVGSDPNAHLDAILALSPAPEYRRFGSPGMAASADYAAEVLETAGYEVLRHDVASTVHAVDYAPGHEPSLVRVQDGMAYRTESAFSIEVTTPAEGITCTVRPFDKVTPGDCGFVPYHQISPEWNNFLGDVTGPVSTVRARGGVGVILQGDTDHHALIALKVAQPIPVVVSLVGEEAIVGREVRLRAMGGEVPATMHNVVAVRPPTDPKQGYVLLQGHLDGWFAAAADNGGGAAAVLAAAERMAGDRGGRGLLVALYDAEEWGLRGSKALAADLARPEGLAIGDCGPVVRMEDIAAIVNLDASSAIPSDLLGPVRDLTGVLVPLFSWRLHVFSEEPTVAALLVATMTAASVLGAPMPVSVADPINGGISRTDGRWFHEAGVPVAWPVAGYPEYHTEADDIDAVDPVDLTNLTTGAVALVRALDTAPVARLDGSKLPMPGSSAAPESAACAEQAPVVDAAMGAAAPTTTAPTGLRSIPATGGQVALLPPALALALGLLLVGRYRTRS